MGTSIEKYLASGTGNIAESVDLTAPDGYQVLNLRVSFASNATNDLTVSVVKGVEYTYVETTLSGSGVTLMSWTPTDFFMPDDETLDFAWTNPGVVAWTLRLIVEKL